MKRVLACCLLLVWPALAEPMFFEQANKLLEQKRYQEALPLYKKAIVETPNVSVLWNLAITAQYCEDWPEALKAWTHMRFEEPDNWKVRAKLIQVYQGMGPEREA
jgi:tetratricopeptide (TPR) repeat protein